MTHSAQGPSRRTMLKSGAAVGGLVWAVPVVQAVSMTPAHAATTSAPPSVKGTKVSGGKGTKVSGGNPPQAGGVSAVSNDRSTLPRTGADIGPVAAVGAGAVALGTAAVVTARKRQSSSADSAPDQT